MNEELDFFQNLFDPATQKINMTLLGLQLILTPLLCFIISYFYVRFGNSLSNRKALSKNFVLIGLTTMIIITIVKSSLALSLGLVGALSIVRFRTAIKEPEELAYFFIVICIGLGIGAEQMLVTFIGTLTICLVIFITNRKTVEEVTQNLIIRLPAANRNQSEGLVEHLRSKSSALELRRMDENSDGLELSFGISFKDLKSLMEVKDHLHEKFPDASFSFLQKV